MAGVINPAYAFTAQARIAQTLNQVVPSSTVPLYVNLQWYDKATILISAKNSTTVTGSAITLLQATDVAGSGEKALSFVEMFENLDTEAGDGLNATAVVADTFTLDSTDNANLLYAIELTKADDLDTANGFDCVRVGVGNAVAQSITIMTILWPPTLQVGNVSGTFANPSAMVD